MYDIFIISDDVVGTKMAGPGIRAFEIAKSLSQQYKVILGIPDFSYREGDEAFYKSHSFDFHAYSLSDPSSVREIGEKSRIILFQGYILSKFPCLKELPAYIIVDLYFPFPLETLFIHKWQIPSLKDREFAHMKDLRVFDDQIVYGDHFICASERQKDLYLGSLLTLNRINPDILDTDASLNELISIVPFGFPEETGDLTPVNSVRDRVPEIQSDDILLLWGGVITNWFDPLTLIRSIDLAAKENPKIKLYFITTVHPNPLLPEFDMARESKKLSASLGLTNKHVFFNEEWVDYKYRADYFGAADIGVSIHETHFETRYSFRTRILDYLKFDLPILCTDGDYFGELVKEKKLGIAVPSGDVTRLTQAILTLAQDAELRKQCQENILFVKSIFIWDKLTETFPILVR